MERTAMIFSMLCLCAGAAVAQECVEVSEDGRTAAAFAPSQDGGQGWAEEGVGIPFSMTPAWSLSLRRQVGAVRIADLNNDGKNDLFVGCFISNSFPPYTDWEDMIFYNTGDAQAPLPAAPGWVSADEVHTGDAQIGDINGDGFPDVVAITGGTSFSPPRIYFGSATGPSTSPGWISAPPTAGWATGGCLFDADGDGDLDLFTTNQGVSPNANRPMYVHSNTGSTLETTPSWQSAESSIQNTGAAADFDGDGDLDVAVSKWVNFESGVYRNAGTALETAMAWGVGSTGTDRGVAWGDIDGDGDPDLALGVGGAGTRVWRNDGGALVPSGYESDPPFNGHQEIALVDVDNDGDPDLGEVHFSDGRTHWYLNDAGSLAVTPSWTYDATTVANAIAVGDLNGDGWKDLAIGFSGDVSVRVFLAIPPVPACDSIDFNGDGLFPDNQDLQDFLDVFGGGACSTGTCGDLDFNNDGLFPDNLDLEAFFSVFGGGAC
ncbi:MAG TPA: VCBS repeat-containing protein [Phycisphaerales bacterium]|nr:VCBS repeat-containing protein [Phycisphaerales bacterium]